MTFPLKPAPTLIHILIVEDSPTQGESLRYLLEQNQYQVAWAQNGKLALSYLKETRPALVISDINMPEMSGFELCQRIKSEEDLQAIPVILLTSLSDTQDVLEGLSCGADSFITKPFSAIYLLDLVKRTLAEQSTLSQSRARMEVEINLAGKSRLIITSPQQTVSLLLSTYEAAIHRNLELVHTQAELNTLNEHLEDLVNQRTATLSAEINERKQAEAVLRASERFARSTIDALTAHLAILDEAGTIIAVNHAWSKFAEDNARVPSKPQSYIGTNYLALCESVIGLDLSEALAIAAGIRAVIDGQQIEFLLEYACHSPAEKRWFIAHVTRFTGDNDRRVVIAHENITQRKLAESALVNSEIAYRTLFENAPIGLYRTSVGGRILEANPALAKTFGYSTQAALQVKNIVELYVDPASNEKFRREIEKSGVVSNFEAEFYRPDGSTFWANDFVRAVRDSAGEIQFYEGSLVDITERQRSNEKIRFQATLLDTVGQAVIAVDLSGIILYWNHFAETLYGWTATEALGRNLTQDMISGTTPELGVEIFANLKTGKSWSGEYPVRRRDGTHFPALVVDSPILSEDGTLIGIVGISTDISEIKQHEHELEALAEASRRLRTAESRAEMPSVILDMLMTLFKTDGASLIIHDVAAGEWLVELGRGSLANATGVRQPVGTGLSGQIIASGQLYLSDNLREDPRARPLITLPETLALAGAPLVAQNQTIGILWMGRATPFTPSEVRTLVAFADIAANAIQRATLHNQTERRLRQLQSLHAIDQAIKSSLDLRLTLTLLLEHITIQLQVDAACILIVNHHTKFLEFSTGRGFHNKTTDRVQVRLGEGYAGQAALERRIIHIPNLSAQHDNPRLLKTLAGESFVSYYAVPLVAKGQVQGVLEIFHRETIKPDQEWQEFLEALADQTAIAIDSAQLFTELQRTNTDLLMAYSATIEGWSRALDLRDKETEGHSQRVTEITLDLAQAMHSFSEAEFTYIRWGSLLHDIGKMGVPDHILLKPGKLTDEEWSIMRQHPAFAFQLLLPIAYLKPALDIPYCHHEKWDGTGYPRGLKGQSIPLSARLFAIVDVWDALRSDRPYRLGWPEDKVRQYILDQAGTHFDPQVVQVFFQMLSSANHRAGVGG